jgi:hypothetical protein
MSDTQYNFDERYEFSSSAKKKLAILGIAGLLILVLGILFTMNADSSGEHTQNLQETSTPTLLASAEGVDAVLVSEGGEEHHGSPAWLKRIYVSMWQNNVFFTGLAVIGLFFVAIQYASQAGWSAGFIRIPESFGYWIPFAGLIAIVLFFVAGSDIFHWTHTDLYDTSSPNYDPIISGKKAFFFWPASEHPGFPVFWFARLILFFGMWYLFFLKLRGLSLKEDLEGGTAHWTKARTISAWFLIFFGVSSSIAAWDWVMSIDTHWFSTMFGWYVFASWWVSGLALIVLILAILKGKGLLSIVNTDSVHDLGKFVFAFSIFWMYIWFSQFMLIYYANIPEESIYFIERINTQYSSFFYLNLILNFVFPFLLFMTRSSKRRLIFVKIIAVIVLVGHWLDYYLMVTPGTMKYDGGLGFTEIGITMIFASLFLYVILSNLAKVPLIAKNHPLLEESLHHHV